MGRTMGVPCLYEFASTQREFITAIGVPDFENGSRYALSFCDKKHEAGFLVLNHGKQRDRAVLDRHLNGKPGTYLAVIHLERANLDPVLRNADVARTVMPH